MEEKLTRKRKKQTSTVQQPKENQFTITLPIEVAKKWLGVKKGDKIEFSPYMEKICLEKI